MRKGLIALACAGALLVPASASAAIQTYAGDTAAGRVALDVKVDRHGTIKKILEVRGYPITIDCEQSGRIEGTNFTVSTVIRVIAGEFDFEYTDAYGNLSYLHGKFKGRRLQKTAGTWQYAGHYPAENDYPEEDCTTGPQTFLLKRGAADVVPPPPRPLR